MRPCVADRPALESGDNEECQHVYKSDTHGTEDQDAKSVLRKHTQIEAQNCDLRHGDDRDV